MLAACAAGPRTRATSPAAVATTSRARALFHRPPSMSCPLPGRARGTNEPSTWGISPFCPHCPASDSGSAPGGRWDERGLTDGPCSEATVELLAARRAAAEQRAWEAARRAGEDAAHRYADWVRIHDGLARCVEETRSFRGLPASRLRDGGATTVVRRDERIFVALADVHLLEPRSTGGRMVGGLFVPGLDQPT